VKNAFSIQKLFLDLNTAVLESVPTIVGIPAGWPVWNLITTVFLGAYFTELQKKGDPVLSYSFTLNAPRPTTLELGSVSRECDPLLDPNGQPINNPTAAQKNAATLVYVGTHSKTPPVPVPFPWNWVELGDVTAFSGVEAVRRDVTLTHDGETFTVSYSSKQSGSPQVFRPIMPIGAPAADGFVDVASLSFTNN